MIKPFKEVNDHWSFFDRLEKVETLIYRITTKLFFLFLKH